MREIDQSWKECAPIYGLGLNGSNWLSSSVPVKEVASGAYADAHQKSGTYRRLPEDGTNHDTASSSVTAVSYYYLEQIENHAPSMNGFLSHTTKPHKSQPTTSSSSSEEIKKNIAPALRYEPHDVRVSAPTLIETHAHHFFD